MALADNDWIKLLAAWLSAILCLEMKAEPMARFSNISNIQAAVDGLEYAYEFGNLCRTSDEAVGQELLRNLWFSLTRQQQFQRWHM